MGGEIVQMAAQGVGCQQIVGVKKNQKISPRHAYAGVTRRREPLVFLMNITNGRTQPLGHYGGVVCRTVVHDNDFHRQPVFLLATNAVDCFRQKMPIVIARDDD